MAWSTSGAEGIQARGHMPRNVIGLVQLSDKYHQTFFGLERCNQFSLWCGWLDGAHHLKCQPGCLKILFDTRSALCLHDDIPCSWYHRKVINIMPSEEPSVYHFANPSALAWGVELRNRATVWKYTQTYVYESRPQTSLEYSLEYSEQVWKHLDWLSGSP